MHGNLLLIIADLYHHLSQVFVWLQLTNRLLTIVDHDLILSTKWVSMWCSKLMLLLDNMSMNLCLLARLQYLWLLLGKAHFLHKLVMTHRCNLTCTLTSRKLWCGWLPGNRWARFPLFVCLNHGHLTYIRHLLMYHWLVLLLWGQKTADIARSKLLRFPGRSSLVLEYTIGWWNCLLIVLGDVSVILHKLFATITSTAWLGLCLSLLLARCWCQVLLAWAIWEVRVWPPVLDNLWLSHAHFTTSGCSFYLFTLLIDADSIDKIVVWLRESFILLLLSRWKGSTCSIRINITLACQWRNLMKIT